MSDSHQERKPSPQKKNLFVELLKALSSTAGIILIILGTRAFLIDHFVIPSGSMIPKPFDRRSCFS